MIQFKDVEIAFNDFIAVKNLNLNINEGDFFTLLGPSGCGKTTTLRSLVGFTTPTKGQIFVNGEDMTHKPSEKRGISMVFQSYALFPTLSVYENIAFGPKVKKLSKDKVDKIVRDIAQKVDLDENQLKRKVSELSGGQQQRVAIARALAMEPKILVLDEPLSNLDAKLRVQLRKELKLLQKRFGITTIYVTHDQEEALTLSDQIAVFNKGVVEQVGTPEAIYNQSETEFVCNFIGDINRIDSLVKELYVDYNKFYVRVEKVRIADQEVVSEQEIGFTGEIIDKEFYGMYTKYTLLCDKETVIKIIEKDLMEIGSQMQLVINKKDILKYK